MMLHGKSLTISAMHCNKTAISCNKCCNWCNKAARHSSSVYNQQKHVSQVFNNHRCKLGENIGGGTAKWVMGSGGQSPSTIQWQNPRQGVWGMESPRSWSIFVNTKHLISHVKIILLLIIISWLLFLPLYLQRPYRRTGLSGLNILHIFYTCLKNCIFVSVRTLSNFHQV